YARCRPFRGVQRQSQCPKPITMPVSVPFASKPRMLRAGHFLAHTAEISPDGVGGRDLDRPFFKSDAHWVGQLLFSRCLKEMPSTRYAPNFFVARSANCRPN